MAEKGSGIHFSEPFVISGHGHDVPLTGLSQPSILNHMVQYIPSTLDSTFAALSDPTRRAILAQLSRGDCAVSELAQPFDMSLTAVAKHLKVLEGAGLVQRQKVGRVVHCRLDAARMREAAEWLAGYERFWRTRLDALARYLEESPD